VFGLNVFGNQHGEIRMTADQDGFKQRIETLSEPGMVVYACNPSTWEAEAGGCQVQDQPEPCILARVGSQML
jgi:hypothetical protein